MANVFEAVIGAVDHATGPFKAVANAVRGLGHASEETRHDVEKLGHTHTFETMSGHVTLLRGHFGELRAGIGEVGHSITELLPQLGALGAGASLVALVELTEKVAEARSEFLKMSTEIGIAPERLQAFNTAAKLADVSTESLQQGLVKLDRSIAMAAGGKNKDALALFNHLKISLRDSHGHLKTVTELMPQLSDAFRRTSDPAMRVRMAMTLFGKAGADLIPLLAKGSAGLKEFSEISERVNYAPTKEEDEGIEEFHKNTVILGLAMKGLTDEIGSKLAPILAPVIGQVSDWVAANRDWIATGIASKVEQLADIVKEILPHIHEIVERIHDWASGAMAVGGHVGGLTTIVGALALVLGSPLISAVTGAITIFKSLMEVMEAMKVLALANPWVALGVATVAVATLIYTHWDWVKTKLGEIFTWFEGQSAWVKALLVIVAPIIGVPLEIAEHWSVLKTFFTTLWADIGSIFTQAWAHISPIVDRISGAAKFFENGFIGRHLGLSGGSDAGQAPTDGAPTGGPRVTPLTSPYSPGADAGAGAPGAPGQNGTSKVTIDIKNLPPGSNVSQSNTGTAPAPDLSVGYANPMAYGF